MKKVLFFGALMLFSTFSFGSVKTLTIVNHFKQPLKFVVDRNPQIVPELNPKFTLEANQEIYTKVLPGPEGVNRAYIAASVINDVGTNAFFGVDSERISGYLGVKMAYTWKNQSHTTMIFCTPDEYKQKGSC